MVHAPLELVPARLLLHPGETYFVDWAGGPGREAPGVVLRFTSEDPEVAAVLPGAAPGAGAA
eukprot:2888745-Pyramimonas_sp.AAC.1